MTPTSTPDLPQWLVWGASSFAVFVAVLVTRLGFLKGASGQALPEKPQAAVGAVVIDMESLHKLTAAIEGLSIALASNKVAVETGFKNLNDTMTDVRVDLARKH